MLYIGGSGGAPGRLFDDARAAMLADVVKPAHAAVAAPRDDDRLALSLPGDEVARLRELRRPADDRPARREHRGPLALVTLRIGVDVGTDGPRPDVGYQGHTWAEAGRPGTAR